MFGGGVVVGGMCPLLEIEISPEMMFGGGGGGGMCPLSEIPPAMGGIRVPVLTTPVLPWVTTLTLRRQPLVCLLSDHQVLWP